MGLASLEGTAVRNDSKSATGCRRSENSPGGRTTGLRAAGCLRLVAACLSLIGAALATGPLRAAIARAFGRSRPPLAALALAIAMAAPSIAAANGNEPTADVLVIVGAPGQEKYAAGFAAAAGAWRQASEAGGARFHLIGLDDRPADDIDPDAAPEPEHPPAETSQDEATPDVANSGATDLQTDEGESAEGPTDRERLRAWIEAIDPAAARPLWIAFLGHGTFDGRDARLNLRGPDVTAAEFAQWLAPVRRPLVVVLGNSASGPFLPLLSGPRRVVITATESGDEVNYARFGERFAEAVNDPAADLDQDGQTSVLEAYLSAARRVQDFYAEELRLATEHALLDDNGDRLGTPPDWFRGIRATKKAEGGASVDGTTAHRIALVESAAERALTADQRAARNRLEEELDALRERKDAMSESDYVRELEVLLRRIGRIYGSESVPASDEAAEDSAPSPTGASEAAPPAEDDQPTADRAPAPDS